MADPSVEFHGYAMMSKPRITDGKFEKWTYHPRLLGDMDIEIDIQYCGCCGSDLHFSSGGWGNGHYPVIVGHEIVGNITKMGRLVAEKHGFKIGQRVGVGAQAHACMNEQGKDCPGCSTGNENHCEVDRVDTYGGQFKDGEWSQGGYAQTVRVDSNFAFSIPDEIDSAEAGPLMCAGSTTFAPLMRNKAEGKRVAVIGFGGLGHLAVQFASKMGAKKVVVVSHSPSKEAEARRLGATDVINISDEKQAGEWKNKIDLVISTVNAKGQGWDKFLDLVAFDGVFISVGLPEEPIKLSLMPINLKRIRFEGSLIGSRKEIKEMLEFCVKHGVRPIVEVHPMSQVNEGVQKMRDGKAHYRIVFSNVDSNKKN